MLAAFGSSFTALMIPLCVKKIADVSIGGTAGGQTILNLGITMAVWVVLFLIFDYIYDYFGHVLGAKMENTLREELFSHIEKLSFSFFDHHKTAHLMSNLTNDMLDLAEFFHHGPEDYLMNFVRFVGASIILLGINVKLGLIVLIFVPAMVLSTILWGKRLRRISREKQARIADINSGAADIISGIRTVQSFTQEENQRERFKRTGDDFQRSRKDVYRTESYADKTITGLNYACTIAVAIIGGLGVMNGSMSLADLIAFVLYINYLTDPIQHLAWMITQFQAGMAGFDRVMDILETEPEIQDAPNAEALADVSGEIEIENLSFSYSEQDEVLDKLNMHIPAGQFTAVVGTSGEGKSTLCALLPRFYSPTEGTIKIDGKDITGLTLKSLRESIAWVQQDTYLFDASIAENIRMGNMNASDEDVKRAASLADADSFISELPEGYDSLVGERGVLLSGGQRQRIGIARAVLKDAPILLLDEATSSLDNLSERRIYDSLMKLRKGKTTLVVAHRLSTVRDAERIIVLDKGKVAEDGTHDELMAKNGIYAELYKRQQN
ncbi:MAG: ABC transporter ATP-binding protein [Clostridia bacterium]|nr:ABC transporter ATP-binding protein [Clostridia bacterium]